MKVVYEMYGADEEGKVFERDYPNLFWRIRQLQHNLTGFVLRNDLYSYVSDACDVSGQPVIVRVSFDSSDAVRYEDFMARYFARAKNSRSSELPRPSFPVTLFVRHGNGATEPYIFPFETYSESSLLAFCDAVRERERYFFRHRFSERG